MSMKNSNELRVILDPEIMDRLQQELYIDEFHKRTLTEVVKEALSLYFMYRDEEKIVPIEEESVGIIMPKMTPIAKGPGAVQRLKAAGIDPNAVIAARRAKRAGRDYNKELEQYFNLL